MLPRANEPEPHTRREEDEEGEMAEPPRAPMTGAERMRRYRKRMKEREEEDRDVMRSARTALTAAERMRNYRKRKKMLQQETGLNDAPVVVNLELMPGGNEDPVQEETTEQGDAEVTLEPMPGGSKDPVRFFPRPDSVQLVPSPRRAILPVDSVTAHGK